jgi:hypothetical protein
VDTSRWRFDASLPEELLQCRIHVFLIVDPHTNKTILVL